MLGTGPGAPPGSALAEPRHAEHLRPERLGGRHRLLLGPGGPAGRVGGALGSLRRRVAVLAALALRRRTVVVGLRRHTPAATAVVVPATVGVGIGLVIVVVVVLRTGLVQGLVELVLVQARRVEGVAATPVGECEERGLPHVVGGDLLAPRPGGQRGGGTGHHDVGPHPVHLERGAGGGDLPQHAVAEHDTGQQGARIGDPLPQGALLLGPARREALGIVVVREPAPHDLDPLVGVPGRGHLDGQPEPVQQLRPQLALFRVHRPDQQEPRGMPYGDALALHVRGAHGRRVQQQVHQVVVEQVDLVDVQDPAMRVGQQPRLERLYALRERPLDVQRPHQPVLGRADGQLHGPRGPRHTGRLRVRPVGTRRIGRGRVTGEPAPGHDGDLGHEGGQRTHGGGLGGPLLPSHEHPADSRTDRVQQQPEPQVVLPDDRGEGIRRTHKASWSTCCSASCPSPADPAKSSPSPFDASDPAISSPSPLDAADPAKSSPSGD
ncbi:hypothetical protein SFIMM107S_05927 [Streptomyces griseus]